MRGFHDALEAQPMSELISEPITPHAGTFGVSRMGRGEPGLPTGFVWRGLSLAVVEELSAWKDSSREGARAGGELYLRRHYFRLRMSDAAIWTVYCTRQAPRSGDPKRRWFLYTLETTEPPKRKSEPQAPARGLSEPGAAGTGRRSATPRG